MNYYIVCCHDLTKPYTAAHSLTSRTGERTGKVKAGKPMSVYKDSFKGKVNLYTEAKQNR